MTVSLQLWLFVESILRMLSTDFSLISTTRAQAILTVESLTSSSQSKEKKNQEIRLFCECSLVLNTGHVFYLTALSSVQSLSRVRLCDPMNRSTPGLPVHHQLPEFIQTDVHRVSDAIQPSHPLSSPSPLAPNPSQHQSLFQ